MRIPRHACARLNDRRFCVSPLGLVDDQPVAPVLDRPFSETGSQRRYESLIVIKTSNEPADLALEYVGERALL